MHFVPNSVSICFCACRNGRGIIAFLGKRIDHCTVSSTATGYKSLRCSRIRQGVSGRRCYVACAYRCFAYLKVTIFACAYYIVAIFRQACCDGVVTYIYRFVACCSAYCCCYLICQAETCYIYRRSAGCPCGAFDCRALSVAVIRVGTCIIPCKRDFALRDCYLIDNRAGGVVDFVGAIYGDSFVAI